MNLTVEKQKECYNFIYETINVFNKREIKNILFGGNKTKIKTLLSQYGLVDYRISSNSENMGLNVDKNALNSNETQQLINLIFEIGYANNVFILSDGFVKKQISYHEGKYQYILDDVICKTAFNLNELI